MKFDLSFLLLLNKDSESSINSSSKKTSFIDLHTHSEHTLSRHTHELTSRSELNDSFNTHSFQNNNNSSNRHQQQPTATTENRLTAMSKASKLSSVVSETKLGGGVGGGGGGATRAKPTGGGGGREKTRREILAEQDFIRRNGIGRIVCRMKTLFSGRRHLVERLKENSMPTTLDDCLVSINLSNSLMSEQQIHELNPLTICVEKIRELPSRPVDFDTLRHLCSDVYCSYKFFGQPVYKTCAVAHDPDIYPNDVNVYLAGLLPKPDLHEFMHASLFEIQVHDRDRKPVAPKPEVTKGGNKSKASLITSVSYSHLKPCLFGNDPTIDERISNVNSIASKHTQHNPFERNEKRWDNYGVARIDLHELALGKRMVEFYVPVLPSSAPDVLAKHTPNQKLAYQKLMSSDEENSPVPCGAYLESNTHLCVRIEVARPLFDENTMAEENIKPVEEQKVN